MASVTPAPSVPGSQAATKPSTLSRSEGSKYIGLPEMRIASVGTLSATKLISLEPLKGMMRDGFCSYTTSVSPPTEALIASRIVVPKRIDIGNSIFMHTGETRENQRLANCFPCQIPV
nr:hypothetical protein Iba_chr07eCG3180 [Ipomoea batatas]